jgi:hypothetical protein
VVMAMVAVGGEILGYRKGILVHSSSPGRMRNCFRPRSSGAEGLCRIAHSWAALGGVKRGKRTKATRKSQPLVGRHKRHVRDDDVLHCACDLSTCLSAKWTQKLMWEKRSERA